MLTTYIFALGIFLAALGLLELVFPAKAFMLWKKWSMSRFFFVHGIVLIAGGFPLTIYDGPLSTAVFIIGCFVVCTGPFLLIYPEKFREMFGSVENEITAPALKKMIITEAVIRIAVAALLIIASSL
ncbi:MAG TPA: hypothetical protein P5295_00255 [Spirochaetota bacterium]|nr:hypothetical protein [Spirochaetota bacterium]